MKIVRNQMGLTLIEVLATLTIMSLLIGVVYGVLINGLNYSSQAKDTVAIQQEANYLITVLNNTHESKYSYNVTVVSVQSNNDTVMIKSKEKADSEETENRIQSNIYSYKICEIDDNTGDCKPNPDININNTNKDSLHVKIVITKENPHLTYEVQTILSRL